MIEWEKHIVQACIPVIILVGLGAKRTYAAHPATLLLENPFVYMVRSPLY